MKNKLFIFLSLFLFSSHLSAQCDPEEVPTAQCVPGFVVQLQPLDTDGDGSPDECFAELFAQNFDNGSFDDTTPSEDLVFYFNDNPEELSMQFDGSNIGPNELTIYVADADGCVSTCNTFLFLEGVFPNPGYCGGISEPELYGTVKTIQNEGINEVEVSIDWATASTNENGSYYFSLSSEGTLTLSCYKNNNPSNGLTGADLIIMRQDILGISSIENPVYRLAGDVNNSGVITTADIVAARQVILGSIDAFPNNTSWRFYHGDIEAGEAVETLILNFNGSNPQVDWTGYKVGDVNGSAEPE